MLQNRFHEHQNVPSGLPGGAENDSRGIPGTDAERMGEGFLKDVYRAASNHDRKEKKDCHPPKKTADDIFVYSYVKNGNAYS